MNAGWDVRKIGQAIDQHYRDNPLHPVNCACLKSVREAYQSLIANVTPQTDAGRATFWLWAQMAIGWRDGVNTAGINKEKATEEKK